MKRTAAEERVLAQKAAECVGPVVGWRTWRRSKKLHLLRTLREVSSMYVSACWEVVPIEWLREDMLPKCKRCLRAAKRLALE